MAVRARPRDAATLLIVRRDAGVPKVLMGRRHRGHAFLPDKWVFPGGGVERGDFRVPAASDLRADVAAALERGAAPTRARAVALAAIRETFEETGLLLARPAPPQRRAGAWGGFLGRGALPDLAALDFVARAITPPGGSRRFDARFFMADAAALISLDHGGSDELGECAWFDWDAAGALDLPLITRQVLAEAALRLAAPDRAIPLFRFVGGRHRVDPI